MKRVKKHNLSDLHEQQSGQFVFTPSLMSANNSYVKLAGSVSLYSLVFLLFFLYHSTTMSSLTQCCIPIFILLCQLYDDYVQILIDI